LREVAYLQHVMQRLRCIGLSASFGRSMFFFAMAGSRTDVRDAFFPHCCFLQGNAFSTCLAGWLAGWVAGWLEIGLTSALVEVVVELN